MLRTLSEPVLLDEWQAVPETFPAVKRAIDSGAGAGRFVLTGSAYGDLEGVTAAGTGRIVPVRLLGMTVREQLGRVGAEPFIDRLARGEEIGTPEVRMDLRDYLDLALRSGFPEALDIAGTVARQRWLDGYVSQIITRDPTGTVGARNPALLLRYLEAYALHSAGIVEAKSIYEAAGVDKRTASSYEQVLENVFVVKSLPAWKTNRLKRLVQSPKRYLLDARRWRPSCGWTRQPSSMTTRCLAARSTRSPRPSCGVRSRYAPPGRVCTTCATPTGDAKLTSSPSWPGNASLGSR